MYEIPSLCEYRMRFLKMLNNTLSQPKEDNQRDRPTKFNVVFWMEMQNRKKEIR